MIYLIVLGIAALIFILIAFAHLVSTTVAGIITPPGQTRFGDIENTQANQSLKSEGYNVTPNWSSDAVAALMKNKGK